ncbi:MAG TPA: selenocysteine-specific translation elongation factor [Candidatus Baltobacteraceae bacterium]|nr:selenocysteine-specific translation elongation factor [Candidatus Baltobacteraceae bacterium]
MHIVGTAGHVDHGKSSLVAALTGTNPDRWLEEQLRGMTLDLGFAHLVLDGGIEAGIVDVPGHERFLHNMLAGAAGMDVLLLVVDVNEGVMPQTREHLDILRYLNVRRTIVALTKIDLLAESELAPARESIADDLRGTIAEGSQTIGVSSHTGAGLDDLRDALAQTLASLPPRDAEAPLYLPVDRVFALPGLGTVVTGTLMQGRIRTGDAVTFAPSGSGARVRSVHVFGKQRDAVEAGSRVALNVPGIDRHDVARGEAVVGREFSGRTNLEVRFTALPGALKLLARRTPVHAYVGSAEILGTLLLEERPGPNEMRARLALRSPVVAFPGVRFVVRRLSPHVLLGGGFVEGIEANAPISDGVTPAESAIASVLANAGTEPMPAAEIAVAANLREDVVAKALDALAERGDAIRVQRPVAFVHAAAAREYLSAVNAHLEELHRAEPWAMGATSIAIARATGKSEALAVRLLSAFADEGRIANRGGYYAAVDFTPALTTKQREFFDDLVSVDASNPFVPVPFEEVTSAVRKAQIPGAAKAFDTLLARGALIKVGECLYRGSQIAQIQARLEQFLLRAGKMTASEFRDLLGTSRKYALPLLEWLDARGITLRSGDYRMLRKRST